MKRRTEQAVAILGEDLVYHLAVSLARAKSRHPVFAISARSGVEAIMEGVLELDNAVYNESFERQLEEATDVVVTGIRFLRLEHAGHGELITEIYIDPEDFMEGAPCSASELRSMLQDLNKKEGGLPAGLTGAWIDEAQFLGGDVDSQPGKIIYAPHIDDAARAPQSLISSKLGRPKIIKWMIEPEDKP